MAKEMTVEEFDRRLEAANERNKQEIAQLQERAKQLEALLHRKQAFEKRLDQVIAEIEREQAEIRAQEKMLRPRPASRRLRRPKVAA